MPVDLNTLRNPDAIAQEGERIYAARYKAAMEADRPGQFVAIDITTEAAYPGEHPEQALGAARNTNPHGVFHLIRIGSAGAFKVSHMSAHDRSNNWLF